MDVTFYGNIAAKGTSLHLGHAFGIRPITLFSIAINRASQAFIPHAPPPSLAPFSRYRDRDTEAAVVRAMNELGYHDEVGKGLWLVYSVRTAVHY